MKVSFREKKPEFVECLRRLEASPVCQSLAMHSFLMLPMQRITRLPLLVDAIFHRLDSGSAEFERCRMTLATLNKVRLLLWRVKMQMFRHHIYPMADCARVQRRSAQGRADPRDVGSVQSVGFRRRQGHFDHVRFPLVGQERWDAATHVARHWCPSHVRPQNPQANGLRFLVHRSPGHHQKEGVNLVVRNLNKSLYVYIITYNLVRKLTPCWITVLATWCKWTSTSVLKNQLGNLGPSWERTWSSWRCCKTTKTKP